MSPSGEFSGRTALITGAAGGILSATAELLAREGANLVLGDLRESGAAEVRGALCAAGVGDPERILACGVDVTDDGSVQQLVAESVRAFGGLDIVIPGAGVYPERRFEEMTVEEWSMLLDLNLTGVFRVIKAALPCLQPGAAIVNVASLAGHRGSPTHAHYAASKAGIISLTRSLAGELRERVRVNAVSPGIIDTPMIHSGGARTIDAFLAATPLGRLGTADEVAQVIAFLASDRASFIHGEVVHVNGGLFMAG